jgi:hypothetical protein
MKNMMLVLALCGTVSAVVVANEEVVEQPLLEGVEVVEVVEVVTGLEGHVEVATGLDTEAPATVIEEANPEAPEAAVETDAAA